MIKNKFFIGQKVFVVVADMVFKGEINNISLFEAADEDQQAELGYTVGYCHGPETRYVSESCIYGTIEEAIKVMPQIFGQAS
ncbi:hypothetical protein [Algivirga pacifica]|uniref:Uncharacterized protein n=1 Tax=Algivirga pacifica TaxID=1162670 RepID=A0ABP9D350_9BACT